MKIFGLIGHPLSHSFSAKYFNRKFSELGLDYQYCLFDITELEDLNKIIADHPNLAGLNVTIPYKKEVIAFLDEIDPIAEKIGAVNVIKMQDKKLKGFNSDYFGFKESLLKWEKDLPNVNAIVLGSGGASSAVQLVLQDLGMSVTVVSRGKKQGVITYRDLGRNEELLASSELIVNTTPLGMQPNTNETPEINFDLINEKHWVFDLVYNPEKTLLLQECEKRGASVKNGLEMLYIQAERSWEIWNS